jgi:cell division protein FtsQ
VSSVYTFREGADDPSDSRYGNGARSNAARFGRPLLLCLTAACALFLLARYVVLPVITIRHIVLTSDVSLSEDELLAISGLQGTTYWHSLATETVRQRLEAYPLIRKARVEKIFPDTVRMTVWARQPVALVLADMGGRSLPVLVDDEGVVFKVCSTSAELDLPVVSGLPPGDASLGERLPGAYVPLFAQLRSLREKSPSLARLVSEVKIVPHAPAAPDSKYDLLIYLTTSTVPILAAGTIDESLLRYSLMVLDLLSNQGVLKNIQELDFRGGDVVYRLKGG